MKLSFEHCEYEELEDMFGIYSVEKPVWLTDWLSADEEISKKEQERIDELQERLEANYKDWQEDELKSFFNIPLIEIVHLFSKDYKKYKTFTQRQMTAQLESINKELVELSGRVELVVSAGKQKPKQPFFLFNEYKPRMKGKNDPLGQLLAAMLVGQRLNIIENQYIYGIYVIGTEWMFVMLNEREYAVSKPYLAVEKDDLITIVKILKKCKKYIEAMIERQQK